MALEELREGDEAARPQLESARRNFGGDVAGVDAEWQSLFEKYDTALDRDTLGQIRSTLNRRNTSRTW